MKALFILPVILLTVSCSMMPAKKIKVTDQDLLTVQEQVRDYRAKHPGRNIKVIFGEGTWYLPKTLSFNKSDVGSGKRPVSWEGVPGGKTVISGGAMISGMHDAGYGIWWANVDSTMKFEQLYVDGIRATRARMPNRTDTLPRIYLTKSRWVYNPDSTIRNITVEVKDRGFFSELSTQGEFEIVVFKDWTTSRFRASGLKSGPGEIFLKPPFMLSENTYNSIFATDADHYSCYLEGDPAFLDEAGEWVHDRQSNKLYYKPLPNQTIEKTSFVAALSEQLIVVEGTRENPVKNLSFENISFQHSAYLLPEYSHDGAQACFYQTGKTGGSERFRIISEAIRMSWASNCSFTGCSVIHTAGNGFFLEEGCHNNLIANTVIEDFGGNGIMIGLPVDPKADTLALPTGNKVAGCTIHAGGLYFQGAVGVWFGFGAHNEISASEIYDMPYTGISMGWQWNPLPTSSRDNRIVNNKIHHVMQVLGDGGGIYTLGFQPGSVISGNEIHDILRSELNHASPNNGMFIDEGSKGYRIENNTIKNTAHTCIRGHRAAGVELTGNTFYMGQFPAVSQTPPYNAMIFTDKDSTIVWPNPGFPKELGYPETVTAFTMKGNKFVGK